MRFFIRIGLVYWVINAIYYPIGYTQNLIPNPSFEESIKIACRAITGRDNIRNYVTYWNAPTNGTTDIFYTDSTNQNGCSVNTINRNIRPRTGGFCAGLYTSAANSMNFNNLNGVPSYREYLQVRLKEPLVIGKIYYAEMYVTPREQSSLQSNNIGFHFSIDSTRINEPIDNYGQLLPYKPQVFESAILTDFKKWYKVSGCFVATEAFQYLLIGNFFDDLHISFKPTIYKTGIEPYFYIDDVKVTEANTDVLPIVNLGMDTVLCSNNSYRIPLPVNPLIQYNWQDGATTNNYNITQAGKYWVTAQTGSCVASDTVNVAVESNVSLPLDTLLCEGNQLILSPRHSNGKYLWSDGSTDSTLTVDKSGIYWVKVLSKYCQLSDTIRVSTIPCANKAPNVITPNNDNKNDKFVVDNLLPEHEWSIEIVSRWGLKIYENAKYDNSWQGENVPSGIYYYCLHSPILNRTLKGWIELLK